MPLLAIFNETEPAGSMARFSGWLEAGYSTIKVKVGWKVEDDLRRVRHIQRALPDVRRIRIDANQGYSKEDACTFARSLDPAGIELFEQACAAGDWDAALAVKRAATSRSCSMNRSTPWRMWRRPRRSERPTSSS